MATEEPVVAIEPKAKQASKPRNPPLHPPYVEMVTDAIATLKEKSGSSQHAITKFIEEKQKQLPPNFKKLLLFHLKKLVASGKIVKVKASFKLPSVEKPKSATATEGKKVPAKPKSVTKAKPATKGKVAAKPKAVAKRKSVTKAKPAAKAKVAAKPKAVAKPKPKAKENPAKVARTSPGKKAAVSKPALKKAAVKKVPAKSVKPKTVKRQGRKQGCYNWDDLVVRQSWPTGDGLLHTGVFLDFIWAYCNGPELVDGGIGFIGRYHYACIHYIAYFLFRKAMKLMVDCSISQNVFGGVVFILLVLEESVAAATCLCAFFQISNKVPIQIPNFM
ncbi:hypothetical protein RHMOL_Rhmol13G0040500 [Rhododendron molle]|nr:hypothetical protein RHMOL_Rhmol13G0040500 [Rhododendron molle]